MGNLVWPPYEDYRDNTEKWQQFERLLKWQDRLILLIPIALLLFFVAFILWVVAFESGQA
jgi:uncharacterized membrane protein (DUF485 family)